MPEPVVKRVPLLERVYQEAQRVYGPFAQIREGALGVCACNDYDGIWMLDPWLRRKNDDEDEEGPSRYRRARRRMAFVRLLDQLKQLPDADEAVINMAWIRWWAYEQKEATSAEV